MFKFEDNVKVAVIILLCCVAIIAHQSIISVNLYNQNRIIIIELVRLQTEVRRFRELQTELNRDLSPVVYFLERVTQQRKTT